MAGINEKDVVHVELREHLDTDVLDSLDQDLDTIRVVRPKKRQ